MDNNNFDISSITDIQGGTYNFTNGTMTLIDQDGQEIDFIISKMDDRVEYTIKYNDIEVGLLNPQTQKIIFGDTEIPMYFMLHDNQNTNYIIKPEDLNITTFNDDYGYCTITDNNGNVIGLFAASEKNPDGSYDLLYNIGDTNPKATYNPDTKEIKIMHSDGVGYDIHKEIDGTFYKLTSPTLPEVQNIKSATIAEDSISITTANNEILDCTLVPVATEEGNTIYYIQDSNGNNIAIYNSSTNQIISTGDNKIDLNDAIVAYGDPWKKNELYIFPENLDLSNMEIVYGYNFNTQLLYILFMDDDKNKIVFEYEQPEIGVFQLKNTNGEVVGIMNTNNGTIDFSSVGGNNDSYIFYKNKCYKISEDSLNSSNIESISFENNNIIINGNINSGCELVPVTNGSNINYIRDSNGNNIAIYNSSTNQIIFAGQDNYVDLAQAPDNNYYPLTGTPLETSSINSVALDTQNQTININVNTDSGTQNLECTLTELYTDGEGNIVYAIQDSTGKTIALYDSNTNQIVSSGQDNSIHLAQAPDNNYYPLTGTPINTSNVNYVALNLEGENKTINLNITNGDTTENLQCTLTELYTDDEGNIVYAIKDNEQNIIALYDIQNGKLSSSGENNFTHLAQAPNNYYYYPLTGTPLNTSDINYVYIDFNDIEINITNGDTTQNIKYNIVTYIDENTGEMVCTIQDDAGKTIALYDSNTNQIISAGQENSVDLDNFMSYGLKRIKISTDNALTTSDINSVALDTQNQTISINITNGDTTQNIPCTLTALYTDENTGNTVYAIKDNEQNIIAIYDSNTNKIVSSGQDNSISLNESFAMSNNQYFKLTGTPLEIEIGMHITLDFNNDRITIEDASYDLIPLYSENEKTYIYGVKNSNNEIIAMYDIQNGKFVSSSDNSTYLIQTSDNDYYSLIHAPLTISDINYVSLDFGNSFIEINSGIENTRYELVTYTTPSGVTIPYLGIKNSSDEFFALYDIQSGKIFSSGENNFAHLAQAPDNNYYPLTGTPLETSTINFVALNTQNQTININVNTETGTQNISCTLEELYTDDEGNIVYTIKDSTGKTIALYDSNANKIISAGQENPVDLDNFMFYDGRYINISADNTLSTSSINSVDLDTQNQTISINITNGDTTQNIPCTLTALYTDSSGKIVYTIQDNAGKTIALYDSNTNQIISSGQENSVDLDNFMVYDGRYINISADNALDTSNINSIYVDSANNKIIINGTQPYDIEQMKDDSGNNIDMWAVKDSSGNIIAVYDNSGNSPTIFAGQDNFVNLDESFRLTDALLDTSNINYVVLNLEGAEKTININITNGDNTENLQCTLTTLYTDDEGNIVYAIKDSTEKTIALYDIQNGKLSSSGENNFTHLAQAPDNNYYPLIGTPLDTSAINSVALDTQNQTIDINITVKGVGTPTLNCTLEELYTDDEENIVYAIKDSTGKTIAIYDSNTNQIISSGQDNSISLNESFAMSNNQYFKLTGTPLETSDINSVTLNTQNRTIDINVNTDTGTQNKICDLIALYNDKEGNTVYGIRDNERNFIAIYDSNTKEIISAGRDNSINLNNSFTLSNGVYTRNPQNTPEHTPATTDMNGHSCNNRYEWS